MYILQIDFQVVPKGGKISEVQKVLQSRLLSKQLSRQMPSCSGTNSVHDGVFWRIFVQCILYIPKFCNKNHSDNYCSNQNLIRIHSNSESWFYSHFLLKSRPFSSLLLFLHTSAWQHNRNVILLHKFQPIPIQPNSQNSLAVLLFVEIFAGCQNAGMEPNGHNFRKLFFGTILTRMNNLLVSLVPMAKQFRVLVYYECAEVRL